MLANRAFAKPLREQARPHPNNANTTARDHHRIVRPRVPRPLHRRLGHRQIKSLGYLYTRKYFFNACLGDHVRHACHAFAIDERRPKFEPWPWQESERPPGHTLQQVWFSGASRCRENSVIASPRP